MDLTWFHWDGDRVDYRPFLFDSIRFDYNSFDYMPAPTVMITGLPLRTVNFLKVCKKIYFDKDVDISKCTALWIAACKDIEVL